MCLLQRSDVLSKECRLKSVGIKRKKRDRQKGWSVRSLFIPLSTAGPRMAEYPVNAAVPNLYPAPSFDLSAL